MPSVKTRSKDKALRRSITSNPYIIPRSPKKQSKKRRSVLKENNLLPMNPEEIDKMLEEELLRSDTDSESVKSNSVMELLLSIKNEQCTKTELTAFNNTIKDQFSTIDSRLNGHQANIDHINERLDKIEKNASMSYNTTELNKQKLLRNNLSIMGIPVTSNENLKNIALEIFRWIGCPVADGDVEKCYRIPVKASNIFIVQFYT